MSRPLRCEIRDDTAMANARQAFRHNDKIYTINIYKDEEVFDLFTAFDAPCILQF